jgi:predicted lipid-binding transport protein (Tim44 family)
MEHALFKLLILVGMFVVWVVRRIRAAAEQPAPSAMAAPAVLPRRVRPRGRAAKPPALPETAPVPPAIPAAAPLVVTRPARAAVRFDFKGQAALRRAFVAQEVLGPPLALRPPRV